MSHEDYKIELFVFPDGTQVEMIVFDPAARTRGATSPAAPRQAADARPRPPRPPCCSPPRRPPKTRTRTAAPSAAARSSTRSTGPLRPRHLDAESSAAPSARRGARSSLGRASVEEFNRELYHGAQAIARAAARMTQRNFEDEAERIVAALERDLILPMDF